MLYVFAALTALIVTLQLTKHWLLSRGNLWWVYRLNLVIFAGYFVTETLVAFNNPVQLPLIFMNIVNVWAFAMSLAGIRRLSQPDALRRNLEKEKECL